MPIDFSCPTCRAKLRVADQLTGQQVSCPTCGSVSVVPKRQTTEYAGDAKPPAEHYPPSGQSPPPSGNPYGAPVLHQTMSVQMPSRQAVVDRTRPAAIVWLVFAILNLVLLVLGMIGGVWNLMENGPNEEDITTLVFCACFSVLSVVGIAGAICMCKMKFHTFCFIGSVATIASGLFCCFVPSGIGVWALVMLALPGTRHHFR